MSRHKQKFSSGRQTWQRLSSYRLWGWGLAWFAACTFGIFTFLMDFLRTGNSSWLWFVTYWVSLAVAVGLAVGVRFATKRLSGSASTAWLNLLFAAIIGGAKNTTVALVASAIGLEENIDIRFRFFGGAFMGSLLIITYAAVTGARTEHARAVRNLSRIQSDLLGARDNLKLVLAEELERLQERSREAVLPKLAQISELLASDTTNVVMIDELKTTVQTRLRPLMDELSDRASARLTFNTKELGGDAPVRFPERVAIGGSIKPFVLTGYMIGSWMFILYYFMGLIGLPYSAAAVATYGLAMLVIRRLTLRFTSIKRKYAILILLAIGILGQAPGLLIVGLLPLNAELSISIPIILFCTGLLTFTVFTYLFILDDERLKLEARISSENTELAKEQAIFEQRLWVFKRSWLFMLHGTVQSALTAALTRLQTFTDNDPYQASLVRADLERAEVALTSLPTTDVDFDSAVAELKASWIGVCKVFVDADMRARRALEQVSGAAYCVNEIIKEAIGNAVRHGEATATQVSITREEDDILDIKIQNDGKPVGKRWKKGIGSRMLDDITVEWSLTSSGRLTTLTARLPI